MERELDVRQIYLIIKKRFWIVIAMTVFFTALGSAYVYLIPRTPIYEASARIFMPANSELFNTLKVVIREPIVLSQVVEQLKLNRSAESLRQQVSVVTIDNSMILQIIVKDTDQARAAEIANTIVEKFTDVASESMFSTKVVSLTEAEAAANPQPVNVKSNFALYVSVAAGMVLGIGLVFLLDSLDNTVKSVNEIEQLLGVAVLGKISKIKRKDVMKKANVQKNLSLRGDSVGP